MKNSKAIGMVILSCSLFPSGVNTVLQAAFSAFFVLFRFRQQAKNVPEK